MDEFVPRPGRLSVAYYTAHALQLVIFMVILSANLLAS